MGSSLLADVGDAIKSILPNALPTDTDGWTALTTPPLECKWQTPSIHFVIMGTVRKMFLCQHPMDLRNKMLIRKSGLCQLIARFETQQRKRNADYMVIMCLKCFVITKQIYTETFKETTLNLLLPTDSTKKRQTARDHYYLGSHLTTVIFVQMFKIKAIAETEQCHNSLGHLPNNLGRL